MRVAIVGSELPFPPTAGNRVRTLNLVVRLAKDHRITFLSHQNVEPGETRAATEYLNDHGVETVVVGRSVPRKSGPAFYARLAVNLASAVPYSVMTHRSPALAEAVAAHARRGLVDLLQAEWTPHVEALRRVRGVPRLVMAHNVESQIWERYAANETNPLKRRYVQTQWRKFERFERRAFHEASRVVTVSPVDAALVRDRFGVPSDRVDVVDNGIDRAAFESMVPDRDPLRILFLGSLEWRPNLDAVGLLLDRIFPAVRSAEPGVALEIVGRKPPAALVRRAAAEPGVTLRADVPDVRPFLARAGVMAVPLRVGGGSRLKILEALASGLPVVSTRVGAEGLCFVDGQHLDLADDPQEFASALLGAIHNPPRARAIAARGRALVLDRYDWDALAAALERSWERCIAQQVSGVS